MSRYVRHPVDRFESWYYYIRSTYYQVLSPSEISLRRIKTSLEECIMGQNGGCNIDLE